MMRGRRLVLFVLQRGDFEGICKLLVGNGLHLDLDSMRIVYADHGMDLSQSW